MERGEIWNRIILIAVGIVLIGLEFYAWGIDSHYKWDFFFLIGLLIAVFLIRKKIKLHSFHFFLFGVFLILHDLGVFGTYSHNFFGLEYDLYVHGYFGLVSALMLYRTYSLVGPYKSRAFMIIAIVAVVLGFSAFHELFEYAGALAVGEGEGVLFIGAGDIDEWDTQKDMRNNLVGALMGLGLYGLYNLFNRRKTVKKKF